jgi:hypothetical protein
MQQGQRPPQTDESTYAPFVGNEQPTLTILATALRKGNSPKQVMAQGTTLQGGQLRKHCLKIKLHDLIRLRGLRVLSGEQSG